MNQAKVCRRWTERSRKGVDKRHETAIPVRRDINGKYLRRKNRRLRGIDERHERVRGFYNSDRNKVPLIDVNNNREEFIAPKCRVFNANGCNPKSTDKKVSSFEKALDELLKSCWEKVQKRRFEKESYDFSKSKIKCKIVYSRGNDAEDVFDIKNLVVKVDVDVEPSDSEKEYVDNVMNNNK